MQTRTISVWVRPPRLIAVGLALGLAMLVSGAPELASILLDSDRCCESECQGSFGDEGCGPSCTQGSCAKTIVTLPNRVLYELGADLSGEVRITVPAPVLSPVPSGIFHPPRA